MNMAYWLHLLFVVYTIILFVRIVSFWFPVWQAHTLVRFVAFYADPYLNFFKRFVPPIGGVLDLSPILAFLVLRIIEAILMSIIR